MGPTNEGMGATPMAESLFDEREHLEQQCPRPDATWKLPSQLFR